LDNKFTVRVSHRLICFVLLCPVAPLVALSRPVRCLDHFRFIRTVPLRLPPWEDIKVQVAVVHSPGFTYYRLARFPSAFFPLLA
jgi:hypothetical protein